MANETVSASEAAEGDPAKLEPLVHLGKVFYRGEKFFWRWVRFRCVCVCLICAAQPVLGHGFTPVYGTEHLKS